MSWQTENTQSTQIQGKERYAVFTVVIPSDHTIRGSIETFLILGNSQMSSS